VARRAPLLLLATLALVGQSAAAQDDDWDLVRTKPRPAPRVPVPVSAEQVYAAWLRAPHDRAAFERVRDAELARGGSLQDLERRLRAELAHGLQGTERMQALARVLHGQGRGEEALELLARALASGRDTARTLLLRAELAPSGGEAERDLLAVLEAGHAARPDERVRALRELVARALERDDIEQARQRLAVLRRAKPSLAPPDALARALSQRGKHAAAAAEYRRALTDATGTERLPLRLELAREELEAGRAEASLATIGEARALAGGRHRGELFELERAARRRLGTLDVLAAELDRSAARSGAGALREAAALWTELGDSARARDSLRRYLMRVPGDVEARAELAALLERSGDLAEAEARYRDLIERAPDGFSYRLKLAELLVTLGRRDEALHLLVQTQARHANDAAPLRALRELYLRWGEQAHAERALDRLLALEPDSDDLRTERARRALAAGDRAAALALLERVGRGSDARAAATRARLLAEHDLLPESVAQARRAVALAPNDRSHVRLLASLLERAGRHAEAEALWRSLLGVGDAQARREARRQLAILARRNGTLAQRTRELEARLRSAPDDLEALRQLAEFYARDPSKLREELGLRERIVTLNPNEVDALRACAEAQQRAGDTRAALHTLRLALSAGAPGEGELTGALELALRHPLEDDARALAERAGALAPDSVEVQRLLGDLYSQRQEHERARTAYRRAIELDGDAHSVRLSLARHAALRSDLAAAREQLLTVLAGARDDELVRSALELYLQLPGEPPLEQRMLDLVTRFPGRAEIRSAWFARGLGDALVLARRVVEGRADDAQRTALRSFVERSLTMLLDALASEERGQRDTALELLEAAPHGAARERLLALAERSTGTLHERARALVILSALEAESRNGRLLALYRHAGRHLRPFALHALVYGGGPEAQLALREALDARDESAVVIALLAYGAGQGPWPMARVAELAEDTRTTVRDVARWTRLRRGVESSANLDPWMLRARADRSAWLAEALFSSDVALRTSAVQLFVRPAEPERAPPPRFPFDARSHATAVTLALAPTAARPTGTELALAVREALDQRGPEALSQLAADRGGLVPRALHDAEVCLDAALREGLAESLREPLAQLAREGQAARPHALALLVQSGGGRRPEIRAAIEGDDLAARHAVLEAAAELPSPLPRELQAWVERALVVHADWPTRMRAARALGGTLSTEAVAHEPVALVRTAAARRTMPARCERARDAAN
jgi:cellulose synthase operon protein C